MKKIILIGLIGVLCIVLLFIIACVRPILPGSYADIIYPATGATVPTEFAVLGVAAKWSVGVEVEPLLFLGSSKSYVGLPPSTVKLLVDGVPYARSSGGNHHVFRLALPPGDHTLALMTPFGNNEITVHATDDPPARFTRLDRTEEYAATVDRLKSALYDFMQTSPSFTFFDGTDGTGGSPFERIFPAGDGAFILFGTMKDRFLSACEVRYIAAIDRIDSAVTPDDIGGAPVVFSWNGAQWERPATITAIDGGGDRFYLVIFDDVNLTLFSVFPDGSTLRRDFPLSAVTPGLAESVKTTFSADILTRAGRDVLFIGVDTYQMNKAPGHFDLLVRGDSAKTVDLGGKNVDGIAPNGDLITLYPASFIGPFDSALIGDTGPVSGYLPFPDTGETFSFSAGSVHETDRFYPEHPRFEVSPPVPCVGCTKEYVPPYYGVAGDVTFGPDVLKTTLGGREEYFMMTR